jgi:hypothetical protein
MTPIGGSQEGCPLGIAIRIMVVVVVVVIVVVMVVASDQTGLAAFGIDFRATVTMCAIHHMRRDVAMNEAGEKLDDYNTSEE